MSKSNEVFKPWSPAPDIPNWYRNALNRDPDLTGLQFWSDMHDKVGAEATWNAFCACCASLGTVIAMTREEASQPAEQGNNFYVVDEWIKNFGIVADWQPYVLMMSNGIPVPEVFQTFCKDHGIKGFDWMAASRLKD